MSNTQTATQTASYTATDIRDVVRQFTTDLRMMASSSGVMSEDEAAKTGHDIEVLATEGFLSGIDVTLLNYYGTELRAVAYDVDEDTGQITSSRPGGVLWPKTPSGNIRVVMRKAMALTDTVRQKLNYSWGPTTVDLSHSKLTSSGGRNYASNGYGLHRKDWA